jgi:hypothetical protein
MLHSFKSASEDTKMLRYLGLTASGVKINSMIFRQDVIDSHDIKTSKMATSFYHKIEVKLKLN